MLAAISVRVSLILILFILMATTTQQVPLGGLVLGVNITPYLALETDYSYLGQMPTANGDKTVDAWSNYLLTRYALSDKAGLYFKLGMSLNDDNWTPSAGTGGELSTVPKLAFGCGISLD
ncbi:hypothetical protein H9K57_24625 (plasmid) [Vibrio parahaemolyticus]|uniref:hypothetical protein n=1 Tax=Vibrio parahaemolyticus TaxID=670 RepID=UPI002045C94F|nr:hypothetical protein [Vibrio parahaemolyticus]UPR42062.1 hypothetical protein H9K57_24625 [Vibrio parahaemolyticus]